MRGYILFGLFWFIGFALITAILLSYGFTDPAVFLTVWGLTSFVWTLFLVNVLTRINTYIHNKE